MIISRRFCSKSHHVSLPILILVSLFSTNAVSKSNPGEYDPTALAPQVLPGEASTPSVESTTQATGLDVFFTQFGRYRLSVNAAGSNNSSHIISVRKPSTDAVVTKAYFMAASHAAAVVGNGDITLDGQTVVWDASVINGISTDTQYFNSVRADVTSLVKLKIDSSVPLTVNFTINEVASKNNFIDGEILAVVFEVPSLLDEEQRTIALLFGGQRLAGDRFEIDLTDPLDPADSNTYVRMGLGISYGFQGIEQYSTVDVNGQRLSTAAGGQDDGDAVNGALITVGGRGDPVGNPSDPFAAPTNPRSDDERYNLLPFVAAQSDKIIVDTQNPSDDDNILFAWFELSGEASINKDTDGDGLLDSWERDGYDHDSDGIIDVPLPALGFDPMHKDIAIAYAWMPKSASDVNRLLVPTNKQLADITNAFSNSFVTNPDGIKGVKIHWKRLQKVAADSDLSPIWTDFDTLMDPLLTDAERKIYHRLLMANRIDSGDLSGISRDIGASDFIVSLGFTNATDAAISGTIMHELGHNLGLRHGGPDDVPYKPSHLSVMNYYYQFDWLIRNGQPWLDYERFRMEDLNEDALQESDGLSKVGSDDVLKKYGMAWQNSATGTVYRKLKNADRFIDWDRDGSRQGVGVQQDVSTDGSRDNLTGNFVEWNNLVYNGGMVGAGSPSLSEELNLDKALRCLSVNDYLQMQTNTVIVE